MRRFNGGTNRGVILIFALWSLSFLSILALQIGLLARQKMTLLSRLENRSQLNFTADAGIKRAIIVLKKDYAKNRKVFTLMNKVFRHNNKGQFQGLKIGEGRSDIVYDYYSDQLTRYIQRFGVVDEESKLNINTASLDELKILVQTVLNFDEEAASDLAHSIIDWREFGQGSITGFFSDDYYENLEHPYRPKGKDFETLDELRLVKGVNDRVFEQLIKYVTVYGDGLVNINTATEPVLMALGLERPVVRKLLALRRGQDNSEATDDDFIFLNTHEMVQVLRQIGKMDREEWIQIDVLNIHHKLKTFSEYYMIQSVGALFRGGGKKTIRCVYNLNRDRVEYWQEF